MTDADYSVARLADRAQIHDVMLRWCRAVDRLDYDEIRAVFHSDAFDSHGMFEGGVDGLIEWLRVRHQTMPFSMHSISNMLIEFTDNDSALVETYCMAVQRHSAEGSASLAAIAGEKAHSGRPVDILGCCRYVDRFARRDGEWRIARRTVVWDSIVMNEVPDNAPTLAANWTVGRRDSEDHVYRERVALGIAPK